MGDWIGIGVVVTLAFLTGIHCHIVWLEWRNEQQETRRDDG